MILNKNKKDTKIDNYSEDTIVAIATAYGIGSISIVKISGNKSISVLKKLTNISPKPRFAHLCKIYDNKKSFLDEAIVLYFQAPFSFTGEDVVEIQCHGGIIISKLILEACVKAGARLAQSGEFSKRAFLNDKMDLSKIESISSMINSKNEQMVKLIANNLKGDLSNFVKQTRKKLVKILAYSEVSIDYGEEDLPANLVSDMKNTLDEIIKQLITIKQGSQKRLTLLDGHKIAIIGKPNVGKSSLLNELLQFNRAIVSSEAGTTRDTIEEYMLINNKLIKIIDTAGIRVSTNSIEEIGISKSIASVKEADIIISLFDSSSELEIQDMKILEMLKEYKNKKQIITVLTKSDLDFKIQKNILKNTIKISCKNKNTQELVNKLEEILIQDNTYDDVLLSSQRQINIIQETIVHIQKSFVHLEDEELEFFSYHITEAIKEIEQITNTFQYSELLDEIFSNFCLGK